MKMWALLLTCSLVLSGIYLTPQFLAYHEGYPFALFLKVDEPSYLNRIIRVEQGYPSVGSEWSYENRDKSNIIPPLPEWTLEFLKRALGLGNDGIVSFARAVLPVLGFLAFYFLLLSMGTDYRISLLGAFWIFADPGIYHYKPLVQVFTHDPAHQFNRFTNPLFGLTWTMLSCLFGYRALVASQNWKLKSFFAGIFVGGTFFVSVFYWTHLALGFVLFAISMKDRKAFLSLGFAFLGATLVAIPYAILMINVQKDPNFTYMSWRNGLMIKDQGWYLLTHKSLWLVTLGGMWFWLQKSKEAAFLRSFAIAGLALYLSTLITGVSIQNFHWNYTLSPFLFCGTFFSLFRLIPTRVEIIAFLLALVGGLGFYGGYREYQTLKLEENGFLTMQDAEYAEVFQWLNVNASKDSVVIAGSETMRYVPSRTGLRVWSEGVMQMVSFEEILDRQQLIWLLEGLTPQELYTRLRPNQPDSIAQPRTGLTMEMVKILEQRGRPIFDQQLNSEIADWVTKHYSNQTASEVLAKVSKYRSNYLIRGPSESHWKGNVDSLLLLEPIGTFGNVRLDKIKSFNISD